MGSIGSMLGVNGGAAGSGFAGPANASIINPLTSTQGQQTYNQTQSALGQQQQFLQALQAQNGVGNQQSVFNQLQGVANGTGPNPAQAQLAQATGANVANQAALMAGQRGASSNPGLIARQAAQQGAQTQQQAANQAATLQANQSLNALNSLGGLSTAQVSQQQQGLQNLNANSQGALGLVNNAIQGVNNSNVGMQSNVNSANADLAKTSMQGQQGMLGGLMNSAGAALALAKGGVVSKYADGDMVQSPQIPTIASASAQTSGPRSAVGKATSQSAGPFQMDNDTTQSQSYKSGYQAGQGIGQAIGAGINALSSSTPSDPFNNANSTDVNSGATAGTPGMHIQQNTSYAHGGKVPALVSPGEQYLPPKALKKVVKDGKNPLAVGERIPGKPKHPGNDYRNDTVKKTLESGGMVIPNKVMQAKNPHFEAMKFVHAHIAKNRNTSKKGQLK